MIDQELQDLLAAWHGADVRAVRREELLARLRSDGEFRRRFAEEINILSELKTVQSTSPRWLRVADSLGWEDDENGGNGSGSKDSDGEFAIGIIERIKNEHAESRIIPLSWLRRWPLAAAALILLSLVLTILLVSPWQSHSGRQVQVGSASPERQPLAVLLGAADVEWEMVKTPPRVGETLHAGILGAKSGRFTFSMLSGVTVSAEAPVELDLSALDAVICRRGKLRVRVPPGAEGFTVNSPDCTVVDRGTEFAVNVNPGLPTDVMVFDGRADVFVENKQNGGTVSTSISESEAVRVTPGSDHPSNIEARPLEFTTMLPAEVVPLEFTESYRDLVMASKPWGYWRFEQDNGGLFPNEVAGGPAFRMHGDIGFREHPGHNRSVLFPGENGDVDTHLLLENPWSPSPATGYSIELWFEAENFSNSTLIALLTAEKQMPHNNHHVVLDIVANKQEMGSIRFLHRWPAGPSLGVNLNSRRIYVPCRWTHLVAQRNGDRLQLFVNGELANETPLDPSQSISPSHVVLGRLLTPEFNAPSNMRRLFRGGLDEVAFYDRPLTPEEIRSHRDAAR